MKHFLVLLSIPFLLMACNERSSREKIGDDQKVKVDAEASYTPALPNPVVNVYVENSGSMLGYITGNTVFKEAIRELLVLLKHHYNEDRIKIHFINTRIRQAKTNNDITTFASTINAQWSSLGDNHISSSLNDVFKMILDNTNRETISVLFSDCIYSISGQNTVELLSEQRTLTKDAFLSSWRQDSLKLATTVVKMKSNFNGIYYDMNNRRTNLNGEERPYYICIIGNNDIITDFNTKIPLENGRLKGFENKYVIQADKAKDIYYSVLLSTDNVGRFREDHQKSTKEYIRGIKKINMRNTGSDKLTFAIAADFKNLPVEDDYLLNVENYSLDGTNFIIKEIKTIDRSHINPNDLVRISQSDPTHVLVVEATGTAISNVKIALNKQIPQWVEEVTITDDAVIKDNLDKTFGLKYLIEGITEAYQIIYPEDRSFFELEISIKK